jgi:hypothetical protein
MRSSHISLHFSSDPVPSGADATNGIGLIGEGVASAERDQFFDCVFDTFDIDFGKDIF